MPSEAVTVAAALLVLLVAAWGVALLAAVVAFERATTMLERERGEWR